jgi:hypothetical protein
MTRALHCTACGIRSEAKCKCHKPYAYIPAREAAVLGVAAHPNWSNRRIAEVVGVDKTVVDVIRKSSGGNPPDASQRLSRDGRKRSMPKRKRKPKGINIPEFTPQEQWESSLVQLATFILTMDEEWTTRFGEWKKFHMTACTYKLISRAAVAWDKLVTSVESESTNNEEETIHAVSIQ